MEPCDSEGSFPTVSGVTVKSAVEEDPPDKWGGHFMGT